MKKHFPTTLVLFLGFLAYCWWTSFQLELNFSNLKSQKILSPIKIMHLTDIHFHGMTSREEKILQWQNEHKPDLIVLTGDTIDEDTPQKEAFAFLSQLKAPLGVWLALGNHEHRLDVFKLIPAIHETGVKVLVNESRQIREDFWLLGVDDASEGYPNWEKTLLHAGDKGFRLTIFHSPLFFDIVTQDTDLVLAGHSHGGQIKLPIIGFPYRPDQVGPYQAGWFKKGNANLFVSKGVGTSILPFRFQIYPEVVIHQISPAP
jgi:uncharacterized protein